ncbi:MAG TPA: UDP-N-acetylmuramoyl-L-alanyl-D-glutamate--2,6-diaminopimelate ligase [bacterium]
MTLRELLRGLTAEPVAAVPIRGLVCHSKQVRPGDVFVAIQGESMDGHTYIDEAITRGASAVVAGHLPVRYGAATREGSQWRTCPCVTVSDTRRALAVMAARFYGHPTEKLRLLGITGTNGKTTTTYLLKSVLEQTGGGVGMLGTIVYQIGSRVLPSMNTTPGPLDLQRYCAQMVGEGLEWCVMEVSSHALAQARTEGLTFEVGLFTNLGSDHLDYHRTRAEYGAAKRRLFEHVREGGYAVVNVDDPFGRTLAQTIPNRRIVTFGVRGPADVTVRGLGYSWRGLSCSLMTPWGIIPISTPMLGRHNAWNIAAATAAAVALGIGPETVQQGLAALADVPGRLERVPNDLGLNILIDYAHTADALQLVLDSIRELTSGRVIVVFGCGGDRDRQKRAEMGRIAGLLADHVILTSDNPRSEDPLAIIREIEAGFPRAFREYQILADREQAISSALYLAHPEDTVLIAGKGHETYQIFGNISVPFVDRDVVQRWLAAQHHAAVAS